MAFLRCILKSAAMVLWTVFLVPTALFSFIISGKWSRVRRGSFWARVWASGAVRILNIRMNIHGEIPKQNGMLLVSNHVSYLDIIVHAANFRIRFTPKSEIRRWFFAGMVTALSSPIWIDRKKPAMAMSYAEEFKNTMCNGVSLLVYPEGTTTDGKSGLLPFKSTVFAAVQQDIPIQPVLVFYRETPTGGATAAWFDETPFLRHVRGVFGLKKITADMYILPQLKSRGEDRKTLAARVREHMMTEYEKYGKHL